jgi:shikimate dehydrogenase
LHSAAIDLDIDFLHWHNFEEIQDRDLIISTTPAGATDDLSIISTKADFFEVIYHPWPTELAKRFQNLGRHVIGGLSLLVEQALFQINYFSQKDFDFDQIRKDLFKVAHEAINK